MKIAWCGLLLAMAAGAGCVEFPLLKESAKSPPAATRKEPAPVTADQVNEGNAYEQAETLRKELDCAAQLEKGPATKVLP